MAFDKTLSERILTVLTAVKGITGKPLFGGYGVFKDGTMFAGVYKTSLIVKLREGACDALLESDTEPFNPMGEGKPMTSWIQVAAPSVDTDEKLRTWLDRALAVIPPKTVAKPKKPKRK